MMPTFLDFDMFVHFAKNNTRLSVVATYSSFFPHCVMQSSHRRLFTSSFMGQQHWQPTVSQVWCLKVRASPFGVGPTEEWLGSHKARGNRIVPFCYMKSFKPY